MCGMIERDYAEQHLHSRALGMESVEREFVQNKKNFCYTSSVLLGVPQFVTKADNFPRCLEPLTNRNLEVMRPSFRKAYSTVFSL